VSARRVERRSGPGRLRRRLLATFWLFYRVDRAVKARLTGAGLLCLGAFGAAAMFAIDIRQTLAYQAVTLAAALLVVAGVGAALARPRVSAWRELPPLATAGQTLAYTLVVRNLGRRVERDLTACERPLERPPSAEAFVRARATSGTCAAGRTRAGRPWRSRFDAWVGYPRWLAILARDRGVRVEPVGVPPIAGGSLARVAARLTPTRRGRVRFAGVTVAAPDPLGLARALVRIEAPGSLLVLPRRYPVEWREPAPGRLGDVAGPSLGPGLGASPAFASTREYRPGDPLRHIDWRGWARLGWPVVKEFETEAAAREALLLDTAARPGAEERFEEAVSVAASFVCAVPTLDRVLIGGESHLLGRGRGLEQALEALACVPAGGSGALASLREAADRHAGALAACVLVLLEWDAQRQALVAGLRARGVPVLALVVLEQGGERLEPGPLADCPERLCALELGRIEQGLARVSARLLLPPAQCEPPATLVGERA